MRWISAIITVGLLTAPGLGDTVDAQYYDSLAEVEANVAGGFEFWTYADTEEVRVVPTAAPQNTVTHPFDDWFNGIYQAFNVTYNPNGSPTVIQVADEQARYLGPLPIDPATNGLVVSAVAMGDRSVDVRNLKLVVPGQPGWTDINYTVSSGDDDYMVVDLRGAQVALVNGFQLVGEVAFSWDGDLNPTGPEDDQWLGVAPVIIPEPGSCLLLGLGLLASRPFRRR